MSGKKQSHVVDLYIEVQYMKMEYQLVWGPLLGCLLILNNTHVLYCTP
jgi:hypothetical protein